MRGPGPITQRSAKRTRPRNEAIGVPSTISAPIGGWNTTSALASMPERDCVVIDNFWPSTATVDLRPGSINQASGMTGQVETIMGYSGQTSSSLWAAVPTGIYNVTTPGTVGSLGIACSSARFIYTNFTNSGVSYLVAVNGVDNLKLYNGTTWTNITGASSPAITGLTTTALNHVILHKKRLWFLTNNSMSAWYLAVDAVGGALTEFPMGGIFQRGGKLLIQGTWTVDGGNGPDDYHLTITTEGELAIYKGVDPSSITTWSLVGVFYIGAPLSNRCLMKYGGDMVYVGQDGVTQLSELLTKVAGRDKNALSFKIQQAVSNAAVNYSGNFGFQLLEYPTENALILNVPYLQNAVQYQYAMNTITQAWTRFLGWNANCFEVWQNKLYYGTLNQVVRAWIGFNDQGIAITGEIRQAYNTFGRAGNKFVDLVRPNLSISGQVTVGVSINTDFVKASSSSTISLGLGASTVWDTAVWDTAVWNGGTNFSSIWSSVPNNPGFFQSFSLRVQTSSATVTWISTDFVLSAGGIL